jgi:isoquinoline 1-oxidoreductase beta subunit
MGKWTRRGFITAGVVAGGLLIGVAIRPGNRSTELAKYLARDGESFLHTWVKLDQNNIVTAIVPHSEMGTGCWHSISSDARRRARCRLESSQV